MENGKQDNKMENLSPKVSIVLPTYNGAKYIRQSIDSCLSQTYTNIELIVVDDGSTDQTPEIVKSCRDQRVRYIRNEKNMRLPRSLNIGFAAAAGEYLTWTSDDNYYDPQAIAVMAEYLDKNRYDFVYCNYYLVKGDDTANLINIKLPRTPSFRHINPIRACFLYTRKVMERTGSYDPQMELVEDYDYWIRVSRNFTMHHLDQPLYYYRDQPASLYNTRTWEVRVVVLLLRIKYDIADEKECNYHLRRMFVLKNGKFLFWNKIYAKIFLSKKVRLIFEQFKKGDLGVSEAKSQLSSIVNRTKKAG